MENSELCPISTWKGVSVGNMFEGFSLTTFLRFFSFRKRVCCINFPLVNQQNIVGFFYGAEQGGICRAGMVIKLQHAHSYRLRMGIGRGLNTKVELLSL